MSKYKSNGNCKFNVSYHIVWIPKYGKRILFDCVENTLKQLLIDKIFELELEGIIECMSVHVHLFVRSIPNYSVSYIGAERLSKKCV